jgi:hypothetical protein
MLERFKVTNHTEVILTQSDKFCTSTLWNKINKFHRKVYVILRKNSLAYEHLRYHGNTAVAKHESILYSTCILIL